MRYLLLVFVVCSVGILMVPNAFAVNERTVTVQNAPGSSVPGCEETDGCFIPNRTTIDPGDTVRWTNPDTSIHYVTSGTASGGQDGGFASNAIMGNAGQMFEHQFTKSGIYNYFCQAHPWMEGTVIVREGPDWTPPSYSPSVPTLPTTATTEERASSNLILDPLPTTFNAIFVPEFQKLGATITFSGGLESTDKQFILRGATIKLVFIGFTLAGEDGNAKKSWEITTDNEGLFTKVITLPPGNNFGIQAVFDGGEAESGRIWSPAKSQTEYFIVTSSSQPSTSSSTSKTSTKLILDRLDDTFNVEGQNSKAVITFSGQLKTVNGGLTIHGQTIKLVFTPSIKEWNNKSEVLKTDSMGKFDQRITIPPGQNYRVYAFFDGGDRSLFESDKSQTEIFNVSQFQTQPPTQSSGSFDPTGFVVFMVVLAVIMVVIIAVAKRVRKKTPIPPIPAGGGGRKRGRPRSQPSTLPSGDGPSLIGRKACPICQWILQLPTDQNRTQTCKSCGWKTGDPIR